MKSFADYKKDAPNWITMANGEFYPDILQDACELYKPVLVLFGQLLKSSEFFPDYPNPNRPCDFVVRGKDGEPVAIGFVRYDSDRGGAQEDDRTGGYVNCAHEILEYETLRRRGLKVIYVNDGPGLLLGSMWDDYAKLEAMNPQRLLVITLRMFNERLTAKWLTKK